MVCFGPGANWVILPPAGQDRLGSRALIGLDENPEEKGDDQRGVAGGRQPQIGADLPEVIEVIVTHFAVEFFYLSGAG